MANFFDDIPNLIAVYNGGDASTIVKSGSTVTSVSPSEGTGAGDLTQKSPGNDILHDGTTLVGQVPAFYNSTDGGGEFGLVGTLNSEMDLSATGFTAVYLAQSHSGGSSSGVQYLSSMPGAPTGSTTPRLGMVNNTSRDATAVISRDLLVSGDVWDATVTTCGFRTDPGPSTATTYHNGSAVDLANVAATDNIEGISLLNAYLSTATTWFRGKAAIMALYARRLTDSEMTEVFTLLEYWRDNNEGPGPTIPTTDSFGPVSTNQDGAVDTWKWQESSDNASWQDVGTILTDVSGQNTTTLTVDRATVSMHGTYVRCEAKTATQTTYSSSAQVLIDGQ